MDVEKKREYKNNKCMSTRDCHHENECEKGSAIF